MIVVLAGSHVASVSAGYNIAERINVADVDWLAHGCRAAEVSYCAEFVLVIKKLCF